MIRRLKVKIKQNQESDKDLLCELTKIKDIAIEKYSKGILRVFEKEDPCYTESDYYKVEFRTRRRKEFAIKVITRFLLDYEAFEIVEIR